MRLEELNAYEIVTKQDISDLNSNAVILKHKKTGARIALLQNDDENKVFYIGFRTPPSESTGVMHILEHSVLCGSKEFPVKDPFIELAKGSLNTFLNAMTYPDKTVYPVASCNDKDFQNLMHVYLDAVFYPNIYNKDLTFKQEGWHYELESPEDELTINGVVYNEMKGAFSSPDDVLEREIFNSLFPDTTYSEESGGDPKSIPHLTYEHYLDIHRQYYHPSNCYIYLYGNMDMKEKLQFIDEHYLSKFDYLEIDSEIKDQKTFTSPIEVTKKFSITDAEPEKDNTYLSYNCVVGDNLSKEQYIAFQVLDYALCTAPGAVLKQKLLDKGIGKDVYSFYDNGVKQPYFSIVAKNTECSKKEEFIEIIEETLQQICKEGLDQNTLKAGLNYYEFKYREADFGSYPPGLMYGLQMFDSWLYDDTKPFIHIDAAKTFHTLKDAIGTDYFENLISKNILQNNHKSIVIVKPQKNLVEEEDEKLRNELSTYKETLTKEQIGDLISKTKELREYQESEDDIELLKCIPVLQREDIKKETDSLYNELRNIQENKSLYHNIATNGIDYVRLLFPIDKIPQEYLPYLGILKSVLGYVDTKSYTYAELFNKINMETGGISPVINVYTNALNLNESTVTFEWKAKVLKGNLPQVFILLNEILMTSKLDNEKRLYEIIAELKSRMQSNIMSAGHQVAAGRATSYFSKAAAILDIINGLPCYRIVEELEANFEQNKGKLIDSLVGLCKYLFHPKNLMFDFTGDEEEYQQFSNLSDEFMKKLYPVKESEHSFSVVPQKKNEGFLSSSQVQYVCRAGNFIKDGYPYTGALRVLKVIMGYDYLWNNVRVKGGAYGCMCSFSKSGDSYFVSYRDPNLTKTIDVYEKAFEYIKQFNQDERSMTQYVIGAISELDTPLTPSAKALKSLSAFMTNQTNEDFQKERDELLGVTKESISNLSKYVEAFMNQSYLCVLGNDEKIKRDAGIFENIENIFKN